MDTLILANMLFQGTATIALILLSAGSSAAELHKNLEVRGWRSTGNVPSVLELLEGTHAVTKPVADVKIEGSAGAVRYG